MGASGIVPAVLPAYERKPHGVASRFGIWWLVVVAFLVPLYWRFYTRVRI